MLWRMDQIILRKRFDENAKITNPREAALLLEEGEEELRSQLHQFPKKCNFNTKFQHLNVHYNL